MNVGENGETASNTVFKTLGSGTIMFGFKTY